jgi:drug/metabolite transporter (DMT)-like permease
VLETIFGTFSTWLVVGERPGTMALLGGAVVIVALVTNELFGMRSRAASATEEAVREAGAGH